MKKVLLTVLIAIVAITVSNAEGIAGKWKASFDSGQGAMELTFNFKVDGEKLTGTVSSQMGDMEITNGKVSGNEISFDVDAMGSSIKHKGKLVGEEIKLKVEMPEGGPGGDGMEMTLKKAEE
jgi:hypothetical protein